MEKNKNTRKRLTMKTLIKILCLSVLWFSCESSTEPEEELLEGNFFYNLGSCELGCWNDIGFPIVPYSTEEVINTFYPACEIYDIVDNNHEAINLDDVLEINKGYGAVCYSNADINIYGTLPNMDCIEYSLNIGSNFISFPLLPT